MSREPTSTQQCSTGRIDVSKMFPALVTSATGVEQPRRDVNTIIQLSSSEHLIHDASHEGERILRCGLDLAQAPSTLREISLAYNDFVSFSGLANMSCCSHLTKLALRSCSIVTTEGIPCDKLPRTLQYLAITSSPRFGGRLQSIEALPPTMVELELEGLSSLMGELPDNFSWVPRSLKKLNLVGCSKLKSKNQMMMTLLGLPQGIEELLLSSCEGLSGRVEEQHWPQIPTSLVWIHLPPHVRPAAEPPSDWAGRKNVGFQFKCQNSGNVPVNAGGVSERRSDNTCAACCDVNCIVQ